MIVFRKLVRDRIPEIIRESHRVPVTETIPEQEMAAALRAKLEEETAELLAAASPEAVCEEAADVLEVLRALTNRAGIPWESVEKARAAKREARGGFDAGIRLLTVSEEA